MSRGMASGLRRLSGLALLAVAAAVVAGWGGRWSWVLDGFSHFRLQYLVALVVLFGLLLAQRMWRAAAVAVVFLVMAGAPVVRYYLPDARPAAVGRAIRLLSYNVYTANPQRAQAVELIRSSGADLVALYEVDRNWTDALRVLDSTYPYRIEIPRDDNFGIAVYSRIKLKSVRQESFGSAGVPSVVVELADDGGLWVFTHPLPPMGAAATRLRDQQLAAIARWLQAHGSEDVAVAGDFNASPWSAALQPLQMLGLRDARLGHGISPTWMRQWPWLAVPIDQVLIGPAFAVDRVALLEATGSDHCPLQVDLRRR